MNLFTNMIPYQRLLHGQCIERFEYGNNPPANNIGKVETIFNQSGKTYFEYDFKENVTTQSKLFTGKLQQHY